MKLSVMREFVRLAASRNYSRTAEELYIAQSALSRHMTALEKELNTQLINRTRNSFELTPMGEIALEGFQKILEDYEAMLDNMSRQAEINDGELHVGFLYYDMDFYVARIREVFHKKYPGIKLFLHSYQPMQLEQDLLDGKIDLAMIYGVSGCGRSDIQYLQFLKIPYVLIYSRNHRFASMEQIELSDLNGETLLIPDKDFEINHAGDGLTQMLKDGKVRIGGTVQIHNYDEVPWIMKDTGAVYISPMVNSEAYGDSTEYRHLFPEIYHSDVSAVWLCENINPAVQLFCSAVRMCYP